MGSGQFFGYSCLIDSSFYISGKGGNIRAPETLIDKFNLVIEVLPFGFDVAKNVAIVATPCQIFGKSLGLTCWAWCCLRRSLT